MPDDAVVLITGASGFIGSAVIRKLAGDYTIVGLDRKGAIVPPAPAHAIDLDLGNNDAILRALDEVREQFGNRIASVIHLAAYYDISGKPNALYDEVTVEGTRRLIDGLRTFHVEQFVFASTMLVHRPTESPYDKINENSPIDPAWAYPESKVRAEKVLRKHHGDIPVVFMRFAGAYDDMAHSVFLAEQISGIYEHRVTAHLYPGMLCAAQSSVHLEDLTDALARVVERRKTLPPVLPLLIGEPDALGYDEIQDIVGQALHGEDWATVRIPKPLAKAGAWFQNKTRNDEAFVKPWMVDESDAHYIVDSSEARSLLGWSPQHSLRETLPRIVKALRRDPTGWYKANKLDASLVAWKGPAAASKSAVKNDASNADRSGSHQNDHKMGAPAPGMSSDGAGNVMVLMDHDESHTRWAHYANIGLGLWLASSFLVLGTSDPASVPHAVVTATAERGLASVEWRSLALAWSDGVAGLLIAFFGFLSLSKRTAWFGQWANCAMGLWLFFAPLIFWAPSASVYSNDMLVGALVIAFSVLVPMMPGMSMAGMMDTKVIPPGWTYCPSTASQRLPIVAMGLIGLLISRHLTAYQLGHISGAWEPFFMGSVADPKNGTEEIITSSVSKAWPIPDAGLGAVSYMLEILMAVMGTRDRWRTMPWMVTFFGILVVPLGVISIFFIIIQPIVIGTWSTPALIAALAMLIMIPFALDELIAMGQFLYWAHCNGKPLIRTFFKGDAIDRGKNYADDASVSLRKTWKEAQRGVTLPWTLAASIAIGVVLMFTRLVFNTDGAMANSDHVVGALVITVAIISTAEVARALRFINIGFGGWLLLAPFLLGSVSGIGLGASLVMGLALITLSLPRGRRSEEHYASWDRFVI